MSSDANQVVVGGTIVDDRFTKDGTSKNGEWSLTKFRIKSHQENGKSSFETFVNIIGWGSMAKTMRQFDKGDRIEVEGRLTGNSWQDKNTGAKRYDLQVEAVSLKRSTLPVDNTVTGGADDSPF